ncbi:unknown [Prevotella sp. CAG:474]|nr:unknown [Prevotella sp. CAG:474]
MWPKSSRTKSRRANASASRWQVSPSSPESVRRKPICTTASCAIAVYTTLTTRTSARRNRVSSSPKATLPAAVSPSAAMSTPKRYSHSAASHSTHSDSPKRWYMRTRSSTCCRRRSTSRRDLMTCATTRSSWLPMPMSTVCTSVCSSSPSSSSSSPTSSRRAMSMFCRRHCSEYVTNATR